VAVRNTDVDRTPFLSSRKAGSILIGKKFKLERAILALGTVDGNRQAITVPLGAVVKVVSGPTGEGNSVVDVLWEGRILTMFAADMEFCGSEVMEPQHHHNRSARA
jgi:hypothetical protein